MELIIADTLFMLSTRFPLSISNYLVIKKLVTLEGYFILIWQNSILLTSV
jgi:hypothetical protein